MTKPQGKMPGKLGSVLRLGPMPESELLLGATNMQGDEGSGALTQVK